jgi:hypothetical protein
MKNFKTLFLLIIFLFSGFLPVFSLPTGKTQGISRFNKKLYKLYFLSDEYNYEEDGSLDMVFGGFRSLSRNRQVFLNITLNLPESVLDNLSTGASFNLISAGNITDDVNAINLTFTETVNPFTEDSSTTESYADTVTSGTLKIVSYSPNSRRARIEFTANSTNYIKDDDEIQASIPITFKASIEIPEKPEPIDSGDDYDSDE